MYATLPPDEPPEEMSRTHPGWGHPGTGKTVFDFRIAGAAIRTARAYARLSQRELAQRSGVSFAAIARIEGNRTTPRWSTMTRCLHACGFRIALVNDVDEVIDFAPVVAERDGAGRHYPSHLRVRKVVKPSDWWNGGGRQTRLIRLDECPPFTFRRRSDLEINDDETGA